MLWVRQLLFCRPSLHVNSALYIPKGNWPASFNPYFKIHPTCTFDLQLSAYYLLQHIPDEKLRCVGPSFNLPSEVQVSLKYFIYSNLLFICSKVSQIFYQIPWWVWKIFLRVWVKPRIESGGLYFHKFLFDFFMGIFSNYTWRKRF